MPKIKIILDKETGSLKLEGVGFTGGKCTKEIDELMKILGVKKISSTAKKDSVRTVGSINTSN